jgi:hypothetical protein
VKWKLKNTQRVSNLTDERVIVMNNLHTARRSPSHSRYIRNRGLVGSTTGNGAGVYVLGTFTQNGGTMQYNAAGGNGGAVFIAAGGSYTITAGTITPNSATGSGNGIYVTASDTLTLSPSGAGAITLSDTVYLAAGVTFNIGADLGTGVNGTITLGFADPDDGRLVAIAGDSSYAEDSASKLVYQSGWSYVADGVEIYLIYESK